MNWVTLSSALVLLICLILGSFTGDDVLTRTTKYPGRWRVVIVAALALFVGVAIGIEMAKR